MTSEIRETSEIDDRRAPDSAEIELAIDIDAPIDAVFDFLVVPDKLFRWLGIGGQVDPRPGGRFHVQLGADDLAIGEYVDVDRPHRVSWTWGWDGNPHIPPGSSRVTVELTSASGATTVRLTHTGLPDAAAADQHNEGWKFFIPRLVAAVAGPDGEETTP